MTFDQWCKQSGRSDRQLAADFRCSAMTIGRTRRGACVPQYRLRRRIEAGTQGAVTLDDMLAAYQAYHRRGGKIAA